MPVARQAEVRSLYSAEGEARPHRRRWTPAAVPALPAMAEQRPTGLQSIDLVFGVLDLKVVHPLTLVV